MTSAIQFGRSACAVALCAMVLASCRPMVAASVRSSSRAGAHERTPGYLGINFRDTSDDEVMSMHLQKAHGAEVTMVDHDGPAGKAGLRPHDVLVQLNGLAIESADALTRMIHDAGAGASVVLSIFRDGRSVTVNAQLADRDQVAKQAWQEHMMATDVIAAPEAPFATEAAAMPTTPQSQGFIASMLRFGPYTGLMLGTMEPQLAGFFGTPGGKGLLVHSVEANSPAAMAGLHAGDVLIRADGTMLRTASDWNKTLRASKGRAVALTIVRDKQQQTVTLLPDLKKHSEVVWPEMAARPAGLYE